jgi:hypothetical protein
VTLSWHSTSHLATAWPTRTCRRGRTTGPPPAAGRRHRRCARPARRPRCSATPTSAGSTATSCLATTRHCARHATSAPESMAPMPRHLCISWTSATDMMPLTPR